MDTLSIAAASGMRSRMQALDLLANNIANANSAGYKADREFYNLYVGPEASAANTESDSSALPVIERHWTDFSDGTSSATGSPLDLALDGQGFFGVNAPGGQVLYTRNGNFQIGGKGELRTKDGYPVRGVDGKPILVNPSADVSVSKDGTVTQAGERKGQLQLAAIADQTKLDKVGGTYFRLTGLDALVQKANASVEQGRLESANGAPAEHAVRLVTISREFEMLQRAMAIGADMNRKAIEEVAKVSS